MNVAIVSLYIAVWIVSWISFLDNGGGKFMVTFTVTIASHDNSRMWNRGKTSTLVGDTPLMPLRVIPFVKRNFCMNHWMNFQFQSALGMAMRAMAPLTRQILLCSVSM